MTDYVAPFHAAMGRLPLVAILRGVRPDEVDRIGDALVDAGFALIEVPLNSPDALESIARLARRHGSRALVGAGTVTDVTDVTRIAEAGGSLIVAPNVDVGVIRAAAARGLVAIPGFATPSEAFAALAAGATALKLFPAEAASPATLKAMLTVLPAQAKVLPVGGITTETMHIWLAAGAAGFGLGSALYRPGLCDEQVAGRALGLVEAWRSAHTNRQLPERVQGEVESS